MKKLLLALGLVVSPVGANGLVCKHCTHSDIGVQKNHEYYFRANLGFPFSRKVKKGFQDSTKFAPHGNAAIGARYKNFGADVEVGYLYFKTRSTLAGFFPTKSSLNSKTLFLNLFFYPTSFRNKISAYAGAGMGLAFNNMGNRYSYFNNAKFLVSNGVRFHSTAFQWMIGGEYMLNNKFSVLADARYIYLGKFKQHNVIGLRSLEKLGSVGTFTVGAKYKF